MSLEPRLPPELEFRIFTTCASVDSQTISVLLLVCRRVKGWIEPLRFRAIIFKFSIETFRRFDGFYSLAMAKPVDFLAQTVLFCAVDRIRHRDRAEKAIDILRRCSGILDLALWTEFQGDLLPFDLCSFKNLRHLSLNWRTVQPVINFLSHAKGDSTSLSITHLLWEMDRIVDLPPLLDNFPSLTHIQFTWWSSDDHASANIWIEALARLAETPRIKLILVHLPNIDWQSMGFSNETHLLSHYPNLNHEKVVVICGDSGHDFRLSEEWSLRLSGENDLWSRAHAILQERSSIPDS